MQRSYFILYILLYVFLLHPVQTLAQKSFGLYFSPNYYPPIDLEDYPDIQFKWDMPGKAQAYLNSGITELKEGSIYVAIQNLNESVRLYPHWVNYYYRGVCNKNLNNLDEAEIDFQKAIKLNKNLPEAYAALGIVSVFKNDFKSAENYFKKALKIKNDFPYAFYYLGNLHFLMLNQEKALEQYNHAISLNPDFSDASLGIAILSMATTEWGEDALSFLNNAIKSDSSNQKALFWRGLYHANFNKYDNCLADWDILLQYSPYNPFFLYLRGCASIAAKNYDQAYADLKKSLMSNEENTDRFAGQQTLLDKRIDLQSVIYYMEREMFGFSDKDISNLKKGFCMLLIRNYGGSYSSFTSVKENTGIVNYLMGLSYEHSGYHIKALNEYNAACNSSSEIPDAFKKRGVYRLELKQYKEAISDFTEMIKLQPVSKAGYKLRGIAHTLSENYEEGIKDLTVFIESDSLDQNAFSTRAYCYQKTNNWKYATYDAEMAYRNSGFKQGLLIATIDSYLKAVDQNPEDLELKYRFAKFLLANQRSSEGIKHMNSLSKKGFLPAKEFLIAYNKKKN